MKSDLIITRFKTEPIIGTKDPNETKTFFGSKMVNVENKIFVDNSKIQYGELIDTVVPENTGYQYFEDSDNKEQTRLVSLFDIKNSHHNVRLVSQPSIDIRNNTQWQITINWKNILTDYIFYKLKNRRTFKSIKYTDVLNENINLYIRDYISNNLLNRYKFNEIHFYVKYYDLEDGDEHIDPNLSFTPMFAENISHEENQIKNINAVEINERLIIDYKQTKPSYIKKFNYCFDLIFIKI